MHSYEIEIKCLLGSKKEADKLKREMQNADPKTKVISKNKQLNHYFIGGDIDRLYEKVESLFSKREKAKLQKIIKDGEDFSIRTRLLNETLFLVLKASIDDNTSANSVSRIEFEEEVNDMTLDELDLLLLGAGFDYQAKWSREREEYTCRGTNVCLDKNAGYGYIAEFERVVKNKAHAKKIQRELRGLMQELGVRELPQDRLERMFAHYNKNWRVFYGTDKIFVIK